MMYWLFFKAVFERLLEKNEDNATIFMGVPTMYALMIKYYDETYGSASQETKNAIREHLQKMRYVFMCIY